ncbi:hypothetical protein Ccrd_021064 [Cynara cardunculus var. scolymus]|uniref:Uncharacterized protein n=1 Tax=Cynara cardunculus var. scolymus TaxID=59895 RepID=A0A103Y1A1_CYNCS|nr:hypothetical protein Ccrd_021064 [Cynara cardunculus var. scolymus]
MFTHFKLSICFPPFAARIGNPVFYISIRLSHWCKRKFFKSLLFDSDLLVFSELYDASKQTANPWIDEIRIFVDNSKTGLESNLRILLILNRSLIES